MRIGDFLFFAPNLPFSQLDLSDARLGQFWEERIEGYYLTPAEQLLDRGCTFAAGLLLLAAIDALSRYDAAPRRAGRRRVGEEFKTFVRDELPSFDTDEAINDLWDRYRNGLAHEARLKDGAEFSLQDQATYTRRGQLVRINPSGLLSEVRGALSRFVAVVTADDLARQQFADLLAADFTFELTGVSSRPAAS